MEFIFFFSILAGYAIHKREWILAVPLSALFLVALIEHLPKVIVSGQ